MVKKAQPDNVIRFEAVVYKVQTLTDNGIRVTLDLDENNTLTMAKLAECQRLGAVLKVTVRESSC